LEGSDDLPFEDAQYQALVDVVLMLAKSYPKIQNHIAGHSDIAPMRKTDPGPYFDWQRFRKALSQAKLT
jgi:AmpD protein